MPEHVIRFRGGWQWNDRDGGPKAPRRVSLPLDGPPHGTSRIVLTRQFGRPPIDPHLEVVALRLEGVIGLVGVWLNGRAMAIPPEENFDLPLAWKELLPSGNLLVLEVAPTAGLIHPPESPSPPRERVPEGRVRGSDLEKESDLVPSACSGSGPEVEVTPWGMISLIIRQPDPPLAPDPAEGLLGGGPHGA